MNKQISHLKSITENILELYYETKFGDLDLLDVFDEWNPIPYEKDEIIYLLKIFCNSVWMPARKNPKVLTKIVESLINNNCVIVIFTMPELSYLIMEYCPMSEIKKLLSYALNFVDDNLWKPEIGFKGPFSGLPFYKALIDYNHLRQNLPELEFWLVSDSDYKNAIKILLRAIHVDDNKVYLWKNDGIELCDLSFGVYASFYTVLMIMFFYALFLDYKLRNDVRECDRDILSKMILGLLFREDLNSVLEKSELISNISSFNIINIEKLSLKQKCYFNLLRLSFLASLLENIKRHHAVCQDYDYGNLRKIFGESGSFKISDMFLKEEEDLSLITSIVLADCRALLYELAKICDLHELNILDNRIRALDLSIS